MQGCAVETATFISQSLEDESDLVLDAARKLKDAVEAVAGTVDV